RPTVLQRRAGDGGEVAGQHGGPPDLRGRNSGSLSHRIRHHSLECALAQLTEEETDEQPLLGLGRAFEERAELFAARSLGTLPRDRLDARDGGIRLEQMERRWRLRWCGQVAKSRPPDADGSLWQP